MSKEISVSGRLVFDDGKTRVTFNKGVMEIDSSGKQVVHHVQSIGHSADEALDKGDLTTLGWAMFYNRDATNYVTIHHGDDGTAVLKLKAGETAGPLRLGTNTPWALANTAAVELEYLIIED